MAGERESLEGYFSRKKIPSSKSELPDKVGIKMPYREYFSGDNPFSPKNVTSAVRDLLSNVLLNVHSFIYSFFLYLDSEDLFSEVLQVVERGLCGDGVDEHEALAVLHVQIAHRSELFLKKERNISRDTDEKSLRHL